MRHDPGRRIPCRDLPPGSQAFREDVCRRRQHSRGLRVARLTGRSCWLRNGRICIAGSAGGTCPTAAGKLRACTVSTCPPLSGMPAIAQLAEHLTVDTLQ